jgi:hypothetical protein
MKELYAKYKEKETLVDTLPVKQLKEMGYSDEHIAEIQKDLSNGEF